MAILQSARAESPSVPPIDDAYRWRICVVSDDLSGPPDEGCKKFTMRVARALSRDHDVALISTRGPLSIRDARLAPAPRTFLSRKLRRELKHWRPEVIIYVARPSTTLNSFVRSRILKAYCPQAKVVLVGLQAWHHTALERRLIRLLRPELVCVQSVESRRYLESLGCFVKVLPSGVDTQVFQPVTPQQRRDLRIQYGLRTNLPVMLHVGHLQAGRGIRVLSDLAASGTCQAVLVASSSTRQESELAEELRAAGVTVVTDYQRHIEHWYQLADCYVFPVQSSANSIDVPLSVLEAFACDLPTVTTRFGDLFRLFGSREHAGLVFVDSSEELVREATRMSELHAKGNRDLALPYSWEIIAEALLDRTCSDQVSEEKMDA